MWNCEDESIQGNFSFHSNKSQDLYVPNWVLCHHKIYSNLSLTSQAVTKWTNNFQWSPVTDHCSSHIMEAIMAEYTIQYFISVKIAWEVLVTQCVQVFLSWWKWISLYFHIWYDSMVSLLWCWIYLAFVSLRILLFWPALYAVCPYVC